MNKLNSAFLGVSAILLCAGAVVFMGAQSSRKAADEKPLVATLTTIPEFALTTEIAGEKIDLSRYDMYERFDRELTSFSYTHNATTLILKRANRLFPIIEPILKQQNIPEDFIYLCAIESTLNTRALSPVKAAGLWQIMETTGKELGLEINAYVDERYDIEKSTIAASKFLKRAYQKYGSWMAVAASYNAGQGRISTELSKQQSEDVFDLWLNEETNRYPFRMMALKEIMKNPYKYGFVLKSNQLYKPIRTTDVKVKEPIDDLAAFAISQGITYAQLKEFNPWLRNRSLPNKTGKEYTIRIPVKEDLYYGKEKTVAYRKNWVVE
ncbi:MAG: lytic transglycosylase domain-containing protein [Bacteroidales bacterium]